MFRKGIFPLSRRWILEGSSPLFGVLNPKCPPPQNEGMTPTLSELISELRNRIDMIFFKHNFRMCTLRKKLSGTRYGCFSAKIQRFKKKVTKISRWGVPTYLESVIYSCPTYFLIRQVHIFAASNRPRWFEVNMPALILITRQYNVM